MPVFLKDKYSYHSKACKIGFCWTMLFFGWLVPLFRGDWKWTFIMFIAAVFLSQSWAEIPGFILNWNGLFRIMMACLYNRIFISELLQRGYEPASEIDRHTLSSHGFFD